LLQWLNYWAAKGRGPEALKAIDQYLLQGEDSYAIKGMLDRAFEISLKTEGKTAAYKWLVRAHIEQRGWQKYWTAHDKNIKRLEIASRLYKSKWQDFIRDTSEAQGSWRRSAGLTIGAERLVHFLILVSQVDLAVKMTEAMVRITVAEVEDQPLPELKWLQ
jgi:hypothetical protein